MYFLLPFQIILLNFVIFVTPFCVKNNSCHDVKATIYEETSSSAFDKTVSSGGEECCNPTANGCHFIGGTFQDENLILRINCFPSGGALTQKVVGCTNCAFSIDDNGLITVSHEETGKVRSIVSCQHKADASFISTPDKEYPHDEL